MYFQFVLDVVGEVFIGGRYELVGVLAYLSRIHVLVPEQSLCCVIFCFTEGDTKVVWNVGLQV